MMNWEEERVSSKELEVVSRGGWMLAFGAMVKKQKQCDGDHVCIGYRRLSTAWIKHLARTLQM